MIRVLVTTTSFQDTPGPHHQQLADAGYEMITARGPLSEDQLLELVGDVDAILCGDDVISEKVLKKALPRLKVISKYGIGVDKIDVKAVTEAGIPLGFCPGVNHTTVAEHVFLLMLALSKNFLEQADITRTGSWKRLIGHEIRDKTLGILGMGRIGKEVAIRGAAFGMKVIAHDVYWDEAFAASHNVKRAANVEELLAAVDVVSIHTNLSDSTRNLFNRRTFDMMKKGAVIINTARGEIVNTADMVEALASGSIGGFGTDVLDVEPPPADHPLLRAKNCIVTPHIGSRTYESVVRQAGMATDNLILMLQGKKPLAQVNEVAPIKPA